MQLSCSWWRMHWADPRRLICCGCCRAGCAAVPLILLVTSAPVSRALAAPLPSHRDAGAVGAARGAAHVGEVAERHAISGEMMEALVTRTGGVPPFIEEVT